jgi:hypothetical protein
MKMTTISQNKYDVTPDNKQELADSLCKKYSSNPVIALDIADILKVIGNATAIAVTEVNGDNIAEVISEIANYQYGNNLVMVLSAKPNPKLTMEELHPFERWTNTLGNDTNIIWSLSENQSIPNLRQIAVISA